MSARLGPSKETYLLVTVTGNWRPPIYPLTREVGIRTYEPLPLIVNENPPSRLGSELAEGSPGTLGIELADGRLGSELADDKLGTLGIEPADGRPGSELAEGSPGTLGIEPAVGRPGSELADGKLGTLVRLGTPVVQTFTPPLDDPVTDPPPYEVVTFPEPPAVAGIGRAGVAGVPTHCDPVGMEVGVPGSVESDPAPGSAAALGSDAGIGSDGVATGPTLASLGNSPATPSAIAVMPAPPATTVVIRLLRVICPPLWFTSSMVDKAVARANDLPG